jgi:hypothetical protein
VKLDTLAARMGGSGGPLEGLSVFSDWSKVSSFIYVCVCVRVCMYMIHVFRYIYVYISIYTYI